MSILSTEALDAKNSLDALPAEQQKTIVQQVLEANPDWIPATEEAKVTLWRTMLIGVIIVGVVAVFGGIFLAANTLDATAAWVLATAAITGMIGLFAKSPTA